MKIQWETQLLGLPVADEVGRRLGRVAAVYCTGDLSTVVWLVVRLPGIRRRWRAIPAGQACWDDAEQITLRVPFRRERVLASPNVDEDTLDSADRRNEVGQFYTARSG